MNAVTAGNAARNRQLAQHHRLEFPALVGRSFRSGISSGTHCKGVFNARRCMIGSDVSRHSIRVVFTTSVRTFRR